MKKISLFILGLSLLSCSGGASYHSDYIARSKGPLKAFMAIPEEASASEKEALEFLYAYMPSADVSDYPSSFYLENVRAAMKVRDRWNVPEREFRHFVLPVRVNNENLDGHRAVFQQELLPRIQGLPMADAILEVNHWCHEKVTYQPSDARTSSPLNTVKNALGRCGEESTFTVAALRSVGIPARQVYTPRWAHTDDNHAWVEAWADGQWHFLGACEPEPVLDLGWFNSPASRAMLMHTKVFGKYDGPEEVVLESPNYTEVNLIDNYAKTARVNFRIISADGTPADSARVDFCIYNYAEFYPAVTKYADKDGRTFIKSGLGDLLVWASKDGHFGYKKVSFGKDENVEITLGRVPWGTLPLKESLTIVPPPESANTPPVSDEQRALNNIRFAREDSLRHAYEAGFPTMDEALAFTAGQGYGHHMANVLVQSRGNSETIKDFMAACGNHERIEAVLEALSNKDLHDVSLDVLQDYYVADTFLGARVENEFLTPFYGYFREHFTPAPQSPEALVGWVRDSITVEDNPLAWRIPMSPQAVFETRSCDARSRDIFFVSAARALGFPAQKDPVTGKVQYLHEGRWLDVSFGGGSVASAPLQGTLQLSYSGRNSVDNPKYYSHFTLSRIDDGRPRLLPFDEGELDMGGGVDWQHVFKDGCTLDEGLYLLVSGNRLSDGSVPVTMQFLRIESGQTTVAPLIIDEPSGSVPVIGFLDAESLFTSADGSARSILSATGRGFYALAILDPGKEPTNHVLRDLATAKAELDAWGRPIVLLCQSASSLERLQQEIAAGRYGTLPSNVVFGIDAPSGSIGKALIEGQKLGGRLPIVVLADSFNRLFFCSEGYTIGLGNQLSAKIRGTQPPINQ